MPIAAPLDVSSSGFNSTALEVSWTEVEDTREKMRGKIGGYQVRAIKQIPLSCLSSKYVSTVVQK